MFTKRIHCFRSQGFFSPVLFLPFGTESVKIHNVYTCNFPSVVTLFSLLYLHWESYNKKIEKKEPVLF